MCSTAELLPLQRFGAAGEGQDVLLLRGPVYLVAECSGEDVPVSGRNLQPLYTETQGNEHIRNEKDNHSQTCLLRDLYRR